MKQDRIEYSKPVPVRIPPDLLARVDALAKKIGEPRSTVMRFAIKLGLGGLEKAFDLDPQKLITLIYPPVVGASELNEGQTSSSSADTEHKLIEKLKKERAREKGGHGDGGHPGAKL